MLVDKKYDYIIAGSGCAGLSLLYRILKEPALSQKKILVLDKDRKNQNDRTWCYWEKGEGLFESIVRHEWPTLEFLSTNFARKFDLNEYRYKMIRGLDFYNYVLNYTKKFENVDFVYEPILNFILDGKDTIVETENKNYKSEYVFNSTNLFFPKITEENTLLQHFMGWEIKTETAMFDPNVGTLMDFRLDQSHGDTFMYVLPTSPTKALVEYTLFTKKVIQRHQYEDALQQYIKEVLKIQNFEIVHKEYGIIPMSKSRFDQHPLGKRGLINIGTAGGSTKASSGYTFQFVQKATSEIVSNLKKGIAPGPRMTYRDKMFHWYDKTVLDVMLQGKMTGKQIFTTMFKKLDPEKILSFLGNESSFKEEFKIMNSLPRLPFTIAGIKSLF